MSTKCSSGAVPGGVLGYLSRTPGEAQRSGFAGKRRSKEAVAVFAARRKRRQADFATTSRRGQSHSPPAGGEISRVQRAQSEPCPLIRHGFAMPPFPIPSVASRHLPLTRGVGPEGKAFGGRVPVRSSDKRSRKAGQRKKRRNSPALYLLWLKPPQSGFNKEGSTHETNQMRKRRNLQT